MDLREGIFDPVCGAGDSNGLPVKSDDECRSRCAMCNECTAWVTNAPEQKEKMSCWLHGGDASFEADQDRNSGLPCRASLKNKAQPPAGVDQPFRKASGKEFGNG